MAEEKQDAQKTLVAFVVGLLIGGLLVWAFSGPSADAPANGDKEKKSEQVEEADKDSEKEVLEVPTEESVAKPPALQVGEGKINVEDQVASKSVKLEGAVYPVSEGWVGVREYNNDELRGILGVVRFSESQGLVPTEIILQRHTIAGNRYAIVVFTEDGDFKFNLAGDVQVDKIFDTFTAQ